MTKSKKRPFRFRILKCHTQKVEYLSSMDTCFELSSIQRLRTRSTICKIYERQLASQMQIIMLFVTSCFIGKKKWVRLNEGRLQKFFVSPACRCIFPLSLPPKSFRTFCSPHVYDIKYWFQTLQIFMTKKKFSYL